MDWNIIESSIMCEYPDLKSDVVTSGSSSARYFYLPKGFKDVGKVLVFGYLEGADKDDFQQLVARLSETAKQFGVSKLVGPLNFSTFLDYRLKMNHFSTPPFPGEPRNNQDVLENFLSAGFNVFQKYYTHEFDTRINLKFQFLISAMGIWAQFRTRGQYALRNLTKDNYLSHLEEIYGLTIAMFSGNFLFQKIPYDVFKRYFEVQWLPSIDFHTSQMVFNRAGKMVGYSLCLVDHRDKRRLLFKTVGVERSERRGGWVALRILRKVYLEAKRNYILCLACLMIEGNKMDRTLKDLSLDTTEYGLFEKKV